MMKQHIRASARAIYSKVTRRLDWRPEYNVIKNFNDEDRLLEFQNSALSKLLLHANKNVPYYHRVLENNKIIRNDVVDLSKFNMVSVLKKEMVRKYFRELISKDHKTRKWYHNSSSGFTGEPTRFIQDAGYDKWFLATEHYYYQDVLGLDDTNAKKVFLWSSPMNLSGGSIGFKDKISAPVINWLANTIFLDGFKMTKENMENYIEIINSYKPELIKGYAGSLYELCRYSEENHIPLYTPTILVSAAETLENYMREQIESVFCTKAYDFYGSREAASLAGECKAGLLHIFTFNNIIELIDAKNQPVKNGESGNVVVTNLHNYSMPFIRYKIGDIGILGPKKCKCGNPLPTLKKIVGRIAEQFVKEDGSTIDASTFFAYLMGVFLNKGLVKKFQVIQEDYKKIRILVIPVRARALNEIEQKNIENKIKVVMGKDCNIIWDFVDEIAKTKSGKYLYAKSLVTR